jgi:type I restriction enzyme S subunit
MAPNEPVRLGDACTKIGSGATPRGGKEAYKGGATTLIRSQNIYHHAFKRSGLTYIEDYQESERVKCRDRAGDVLLNITGRLGCPRCRWAQAMSCLLESISTCCHPRDRYTRETGCSVFSIICLCRAAYQVRFYSRLRAAWQLGTRSNERNALLIRFLLWAWLEQKRSSRCGALDNKIELNRRMNVTLEAMARALFQSWFVDFELVRAKT